MRQLVLLVFGFILGFITATVFPNGVEPGIFLAFMAGCFICLICVTIFSHYFLFHLMNTSNKDQQTDHDERWWQRGEPPPWDR